MKSTDVAPRGYGSLLKEMEQIVNAGRRQSAWAVNTIMSAVYWEIGRCIVEFEQKGQATAEYGERVIVLLASDLKGRFGRGFGKSNLYAFRAFYLAYPEIFQAVLGKSSSSTRSPSKVMAAEYKLALPDEDLLEAELDQTRRLLEARGRK